MPLITKAWLAKVLNEDAGEGRERVVSRVAIIRALGEDIEAALFAAHGTSDPAILDPYKYLETQPPGGYVLNGLPDWWPVDS